MAISIGLPREEHEHTAAVSARLARAFGISEDDDDADEHMQELWDEMFDDMLPSEAASAIEHLSDTELVASRERMASERVVVARVAHFVAQAASPDIAFPEGRFGTHESLMKDAHREIASQLSDGGKVEVSAESITSEVIEAHLVPLVEEVRLKQAAYAAAKEKEATFNERLGR